MALASVLFFSCFLLFCSMFVDQGASAPTPTTGSAQTGLVRVPHPSVSVLEGEQFWLHCRYIKAPNEEEPAITWKIGANSKEMLAGETFFGKRGLILGNSTLHVKDAHLSDSAVFTCTIYADLNTFTFKSHVTVNAPTTRPPLITSSKQIGSSLPTTPPIEGKPDGKPDDVKVIALGSTAINVSWVPVRSSRTGYRSEGFVVNFLEEGQDLPTRLVNNNSLSTYLYNNNLKPDTWYDVSVQAHNSLGDGPPSESIRVKTFHKGYEYERPTTIGRTRPGVNGVSTTGVHGNEDTQEGKGGGSSQVLFIGIAAGAVVLAIFVILGALYCYRKQKCELHQLQSSTIKKHQPSHSSRADMISEVSASPWHGPNDRYMITPSIHMVDGPHGQHPAADSVSGLYPPGMGNTSAQTPLSQQSFPSVPDMGGSSICSPRRKKLPRPGGVPPLDPLTLQESDSEHPAQYGMDHFAYAGSAGETPISIGSPAGTMTRYPPGQTYGDVGFQVFPPPPSHTPPPLEQCEGDYSEVEGGPSPQYHGQQWLSHHPQHVHAEYADNCFTNGNRIASLPRHNGPAAPSNFYPPDVRNGSVHAV